MLQRPHPLGCLLVAAVAAGGCDGSTSGPESQDFNRPPVFDVVTDLHVHHNEPFLVPVSVEDPDGDPVVVAAVELPTWVSFDPHLGTLGGEPGLEQVGSHAVRLRATDGAANTDLELTLTVDNRRPRFALLSGLATEYDSLIRVRLEVIDLDGDPVRVTPERIPAWATFDAQTRTVSGVPGWENVDTRHSVRLSATDGELVTPFAFDVQVKQLTLQCSGSWTSGWPQLCHDGRPVRSEHFLVFSEASSPDARRKAADVAEDALADAMARTGTRWADFAFHPAYTEPLIHLMTDYGQMSQSGLAYAHGAIVRATDSPRYVQFGYTAQRWRDILQHELTHVIEFLLIGDSRYWFVHATWLREGFASWGAGLHTMTTPEDLEAWRQEMSDLAGGGNPIGIRRFADMPASVRNANQTGRYYPAFELATRYLLDPAGNGTNVEDLKGMFEAIEGGVSWSAAFEDAFGMSAEQYEATFWDRARTYLSR